MKVQDLTVEPLTSALEASWSAETSNDPVNWSAENPALGQCAVTALVVQRLLGGELLRAKVGEVSHYWNRLASGQELDLTRHQFARFFPSGIETRSREYVLSFPATLERYQILWTSVASKLGGYEGGIG